MGVTTEFDILEQQFLELIAEFQSLSNSESVLREAIRKEATRAEAAEAGRARAERAADEARAGAAAATAGATQAGAELTQANEQLANTKVQLELSERHRVLLEGRCAEMSTQISSLEREIRQLRPLEATQSNLQRQYTELQERIVAATDDARREASRLESELRRVERCAAGGSEIRERARLAAAAHSREKRLAAAELQHITHELQCANGEISRLRSQIAELEVRMAQSCGENKNIDNPDIEALIETRDALEAERTGTLKLEKALASALADNASLAAHLHSNDNPSTLTQNLTPPGSASNNNCPLDMFLAE